MSTTTLVAPDAVRVWRGFRAPTMNQDTFFDRLGTVFVPSTVKMQVDNGLEGYLPTILADLPNKPETVPDETALIFWESQQTYWNAFNTLATRTYTLTHAAVYKAPDSGADFPARFEGALSQNKPVYLFDRPADWMRGRVKHLVAARPDKQTPDAFLTDAGKVLAQIRETVELEAAIAVVGADHLVYWELSRPAKLGQPSPSGVTLLQKSDTWSRVFAPAPTFLTVGLWDDWPGMDIRPGNSFNMQFKRRRER